VDPRNKLLARIFGCCCPHTGTGRAIQTNDMRTSHELQRALRLTVECWYVCSELQKSCHFCVNVCHLSFKLLFIKLTVSDFSSFITTHHAFAFEDSYGSISITIRKGTYFYKLFRGMTDTIPSKIWAFLPKLPCIVIYVLYTHTCTYILDLNKLSPV
jgi:hypothetical protein